MSDILKDLRAANLARQAEWPGSDEVDHLFRMVELSGECGELSNAVKKFHRSLAKVLGNTVSDEAIIKNLVEEVGDVMICLDLLAIELEKVGITINLSQALVDKFNATSIKHGLETRMTL